MAFPLSFDRVAGTYDEVRPDYPEDLIDDAVCLAGIPDGGRILEVGCGSGQATVQFARRGYRMLCVDPGENLLAYARKRLAAYPGVEFVSSTFEDLKVESLSFDLVTSATAWHWVNPDSGYLKAADALKYGGHIALFWNKHPIPYVGFFSDVQKVYREVVPEWGDPILKGTTEAWIENTRMQIESSGLFRGVQVRSYLWSTRLATDTYLKLLDTFSDHLSLPERKRRQLYDGIRKLIDGKYDGSIERPYISVLFVAEKTPL